MLGRSVHFVKLLLLFLFAAQTGSFVCGTQCVEHQASNSPAMAHCSMHPMQQDGLAIQACSAAHSMCAFDLLASTPQQPVVPSPQIESSSGLLACAAPLIANSVSSTLLRRSPGSSHLTAPLRV